MTSLDIRVSSNFPGRPFLRMARQLCARLNLDVRFSYPTDDTIHMRSRYARGAFDWDVIFVRVDPWHDGPDGRATATPLETHVMRLERSLQSNGASVARGSIVCVCPVPGELATPTTARSEETLRARLMGIPRIQVIDGRMIAARYRVNDVFRASGPLKYHFYTNDFYVALAASVMRIVHCQERVPIKAIAVDADHTLWNGSCAESQYDRLDVGAGREELQRRLRRMRDHGVPLCLLSQNVRPDIEKAFALNPTMPLSLHDFTIVADGWDPKPEKLRRAATQLNISLETFAFIDDNPGQCQAMRTAAPAVRTIQLPQADDEVRGFVERLWILDSAANTSEDVSRETHYRLEHRRNALRHTAPSQEEFTAALDLRVAIRDATDADLPRIVQLSERVSQFTTNPARLTMQEVRAAVDSPTIQCLVVDVSDRFGDYGVVGAVITRGCTGHAVEIQHLLLSCRALHRGVEQYVLRHLAAAAMQNGLAFLRFRIRCTERNLPARRFLAQARGDAEKDAVCEGHVDLDAHAARSFRSYDFQDAAVDALATSEANDESGSFLQDIAAATDAPALHAAIFDAEMAVSPDKSSRAYGLWVTAIQHTWEDVLGVCGIGLDDDLFGRWGASSVDALLACADIKDALDVSLSLAECLSLPSINQQAEATMHRTDIAIPGLVHYSTGSKSPVVFFPPAGGLAYAYLELARHICRGRSTYLLQASELVDRGAPLLSIAEQVERFSQQISMIGQRPQILVGWSFGSITAYEMAQRLAAQKVPVLLLLFDPPSKLSTIDSALPLAGEPPGDCKDPVKRFFDLLDPTATDVRSLAAIARDIYGGALPDHIDQHALWSDLLHRLLAAVPTGQRNHLLLPEYDDADVLRGACVWKNNQLLSSHYEPRDASPSLRCGVFLSTEAGPEHILASALGPAAVETRSYPLRSVEGLSAHSALMERENVALFLQDVREAIAQFDSIYPVRKHDEPFTRWGDTEDLVQPAMTSGPRDWLPMQLPVHGFDV